MGAEKVIKSPNFC